MRLSVPEYEVLVGDVRACLRGMRAESVHTVVTSIPYFALRSYGTEPQVWGMPASACEHLWGDVQPGKRSRWGDTSTLSEKQASNGGSAQMVEALEAAAGQFCQHCGAWRGELGLEPSVDLYISHVVEVFAEVWRVLRRDGTVWLNVADSYAGSPNGRSAATTKASGTDDRTFRDKPTSGIGNGIKPKDLCLVPQRLAIALQEAGWFVRSDIIWAKPNPMPESVSGWTWEPHRIAIKPSERAASHLFLTQSQAGVNMPHSKRDGASFADQSDRWEPCPGCPKCEPNGGLVLVRGSGRPTKSHEYLWLLTRSGTYFYDVEAVKEPSVRPGDVQTFGGQKIREQHLGSTQGRNGHSQWGRTVVTPAGRNRRSVWTINPEPCALEHYAAYPTELVRLCVLAGTPEGGCCAACEAPFARVMETSPDDRKPYATIGLGAKGQALGRVNHLNKVLREDGRGGDLATRERHTTGWRPTCACNDPRPPVPATVCDIFTGSGTTGAVAVYLGRRFVGSELKDEYAAMARERIAAAARDQSLATPLSRPAWAAKPVAGQGSLFGVDR